MFSKIIENYIKKITKNDILNYSKKEQIELNDNELDIVYNIIKNDYKILLYGDSTNIFNKLKNRINPTSYNKIKQLFDFYKNKYKNA